MPESDHFVFDQVFAPTIPGYYDAYPGTIGSGAGMAPEQDMFPASQGTRIPLLFLLAIVLIALGVGAAVWIFWRWRSRRLIRQLLDRHQIDPLVAGWLQMK